MCDAVPQTSEHKVHTEGSQGPRSVGVSGLAPERILVVGFSPFGGRLRSGSQTLLRALEKESPPGAKLEVLSLPVVWGAVEQFALPKIQSFAPTLLLGIGEGKVGQIAFERAARNARSGVDERGSAPANEWIELDGGELLPARLSYQFRRPKEQRLPLVLSEDAGEFLCNNALYHFLGARVPAVGFVHVPPQEMTEDAVYLQQVLPLVRALLEHNRLLLSNQRAGQSSQRLAGGTVS